MKKIVGFIPGADPDADPAIEAGLDPIHVAGLAVHIPLERAVRVADVVTLIGALAEVHGLGRTVLGALLADLAELHDSELDRLVDAGIEMTTDLDPDGDGPASIAFVDPDGNPILIDQFFPKPGG